VIGAFHRSFLERRCVPSVLRLFNREHEDLAPLVLAQDLIFVGGGNTANLAAIWGVHGVDTLLRRAWEQGTVMAGVSAGGLCWFEEGVTDFGPYGYVPGAEPAVDLTRADGLNKTLGSLLQQRDVLAKLPTWPWSPGTLRGFVTVILLPIILFLVQRYLLVFVGLG